VIEERRGERREGRIRESLMYVCSKAYTLVVFGGAAKESTSTVMSND
jgi:hypothetical protein